MLDILEDRIVWQHWHVYTLASGGSVIDDFSLCSRSLEE